MTDLQKRILGSVLSAAVSAAVVYLAPEYQGAALALFAAVMGALHIPRPGDVPKADLVKAASEALSAPPSVK